VRWGLSQQLRIGELAERVDMSGQPGDIAERLATRLDVANHNRFEDDCMRDITYGDDGLPPQFAGGYVAWLDDEMLLTAETYDDLRNLLERDARGLMVLSSCGDEGVLRGSA
jgi:hypothetical protein